MRSSMSHSGAAAPSWNEQEQHAYSAEAEVEAQLRHNEMLKSVHTLQSMASELDQDFAVGGRAHGRSYQVPRAPT